ncbi:hypothetical protein ACFWIA_12405 [Streptomyces sp. NPDC127068]|uniref:hypothetical protein n=1 Tax=Streptomyces sp. NPDC127068 TaxID=3347127 RepID=UPI003659C485
MTRVTGARLVVEVGTSTGSSTLAFTLGLSPKVTVITCEASDAYGSESDRPSARPADPLGNR